MKKNGGFTLMELLIVIAIIMILAGAIVARIGTSGEKAKEAKAKAELDEIAAGCRAFYADTGLWPMNGGALMAVSGQGYNETGTATTLTTTLWRGPYLEATGTTLPLDPWGTAYVVEPDDTTNPTLLRANCGSAGHTSTPVLVHIFAT